MEVITDNYITAVSATGENTNYPASFLLNEHPKKPWKGLDTDETVTLTVGPSGRAFGFVKTNANMVNWSVKIDGVEQESGSIDMAALRTYTEMTTGRPAIEWDSGYVNYSRIQVEHTIEVQFVGNSIVQCGVAVAGEPDGFRDPNFGIQLGLFDTSVKKELAAKTPYYRKRDILRTFSGTFVAESKPTPGFWRFLYMIAQRKGEQPLLWRVADQDNHYWTAYARFDGLPSGTLDHVNHGNINFSLAEVL
jgi:hypothetical protein